MQTPLPRNIPAARSWYASITLVRFPGVQAFRFHFPPFSANLIEHSARRGRLKRWNPRPLVLEAAPFPSSRHTPPLFDSAPLRLDALRWHACGRLAEADVHPRAHRHARGRAGGRSRGRAGALPPNAAARTLSRWLSLLVRRVRRAPQYVGARNVAPPSTMAQAKRWRGPLSHSPSSKREGSPAKEEGPLRDAAAPAGDRGLNRYLNALMMAT